MPGFAIVLAAPDAGIPANLYVPLIAWFEVALAGHVAAKPPTPETQYPQLFAVWTTGVACVPVEAGMVFAPLVKVTVAEELARVSVYPTESLVFTVTVSLATV